MGVRYRYVYVDILEGEERNDAIKMIKAINPVLSFPTTVNNGNVIVGFKEDEISESMKGD